MASEPKQPNCEACGLQLSCPDCNDSRPTAADIYTGWLIRTPFGRWEEVRKVQHANQYAPVYIWTKETGETRPFRYWRWTKMDARRPMEATYAGTPEIRIVEYGWTDSPIYAVATHSKSSTSLIGGNDAGVLVEGRFAGRGKGWHVVHHPDPATDNQETIQCASKAQARSKVRELGRQYAKQMGVKMVIAEKR